MKLIAEHQQRGPVDLRQDGVVRLTHLLDELENSAGALSDTKPNSVRFPRITLISMVR